MPEYQLIPIQDKKAWMTALTRCGSFDIYHLPGYHLLAQEQGEGDPYLFFFHDQGEYAALPFLVRNISEVEGLQNFFYTWMLPLYMAIQGL